MHTVGHLKEGPNLKRIGIYKIEGYDWRYHESPEDRRALAALERFDPELGSEIRNEWHRKHGGNEQVEAALSRFAAKRVLFKELSVDQREVFDYAVLDVERMFTSVPHKVGVAPPHWFKARNVSAGLPYLCSKLDVEEQLIEDAYRLSYHIRKTPDRRFSDYKVPPVIPFVKAVPAAVTKYSTRGIWGFPGVITVLESMFFAGIYDLLLKYRDQCDLPMMIGRGGFRKARSLLGSVQPGQGVFCLDYVKGDTNVPAWKMQRAFGIMKKLIDFTVYEGRRVGEETARGNERLFDYLVWYAINTPIVYNDILYRKQGGVPSGGGPTLLLWIIINNIDRAYISRRLWNRPLVKGAGSAGGDDGVGILYNPETTLEEIVAMGAEVGALFHPEPKSNMHMYPDHMKAVTLSTCFSDPLKLERNETELFARAVYPAGWVSCVEESIARVMAVAMSTCKSNRRLCRFAEYYLDSSYVSLDKPIKQDRDLGKYFQFVFGFKHKAFEATTTLRQIALSFFDDISWALLCVRL